MLTTVFLGPVYGGRVECHSTTIPTDLQDPGSTTSRSRNDRRRLERLHDLHQESVPLLNLTFPLLLLTMTQNLSLRLPVLLRRLRRLFHSSLSLSWRVLSSARGKSLMRCCRGRKDSLRWKRPSSRTTGAWRRRCSCNVSSSLLKWMKGRKLMSNV